MQTYQDVRVRRGDLLEVRVESICDGYRLFQGLLSIGREVLLGLELAEQDLHSVNDGVRCPVDMPSAGLEERQRSANAGSCANRATQRVNAQRIQR